MPEESLREIIGIAKNSKWNQIKKFVKFIVRKTLKKNAGYNLTALDVLIKGRKKEKYDQIIKSKEQLKKLDKIKDFNHFSLYQTTSTLNNHINISRNNGTIIVLAKYLGPYPHNHQIFDFSVNLDAIKDPFFTIGNGRKINCSEILEIINLRKKPGKEQRKKALKKKSKNTKKAELENIEAYTFEKLTNHHAIWSKSETKTFQKWKTKIKNKYRKETGKFTHYRGKPTENFRLYLNNLLKNTTVIQKKAKKTTKIKKVKTKKNEKKISEQQVFETLTGKNAVWNGSLTQNFLKWKQRIKNKYRKETGKFTHYNGKPTKNFRLYLEALLKNTAVTQKKAKKSTKKKKAKNKKSKKEVSEQQVFETLTDKNAVWNGSLTQNFLKWKQKIHKNYRKETQNNPYYKQKPTRNYRNYLKKKIKNSTT